jgi:lipoyl-dependent peroxiredoxin
MFAESGVRQEQPNAMALAERKASITWEGDFRIGSGSLGAASGAFSSLPVSFNDRIESDVKTTSPEELIASAHASSYAMTLSNTLAANGNQPERLEVTANCHLDRTTDGLAITRIQLDVRGLVPRLDLDSFQQMAQKAEQKCPVSNALRPAVEIEINAELLSG